MNKTSSDELELDQSRAFFRFFFLGYCEDFDPRLDVTPHILVFLDSSKPKLQNVVF